MTTVGIKGLKRGIDGISDYDAARLWLHVVATKVLFHFRRASSYSSPRTMIPLPVEVVNPGRLYRNSTFVSTVEGIHFVEVCVGVPSNRRAQVREYATRSNRAPKFIHSGVA